MASSTATAATIATTTTTTTTTTTNTTTTTTDPTQVERRLLIQVLTNKIDDRHYNLTGWTNPITFMILVSKYVNICENHQNGIDDYQPL